MASHTSSTEAPATTAHDVRRFALGIIAGGVIIAVLYFGRAVFITSLIAVIIAFILDPFVALLTRIRLPRAVGSFVICSLALLLLYVIGAGAYVQLSGLYQDLPRYSQRIAIIVEAVQKRLEGVEEQTTRLLLPGRYRKQEEERARLQQQEATKKKGRRTEPAPPVQPLPEPTQEETGLPIRAYIYARLSSVYEILLMTSFVPFLVYFMLSWRDHVNRSFLHFFQGEDRLIAARSLEGIAEMVRAFVVGNFLLGLLLALISTTAFWLIGLPYPMLVGPLSGFFSLVPYVGLPLSVLPPLFAALAINQAPVYIAAATIPSVLHLLALNLLYPKIVGSRVHLNPLVVTFSLLIWGYLWDAAGLLLAIPLTAAMKAICDNVKGLRPYGRFLGD